MSGTAVPGPDRVMPLADGVDQVFMAWRRLAHAVRLRERIAERESGLSGAQLFALRQLAAAPGISLGELARRTATHASSVSVVVTRLLEKRLVRREPDPADRRRWLLHATEAGVARLDRAPESADVLLLDAFGTLARDARRELASQLDQLAVAVGVTARPTAAGGQRAANPRREVGRSGHSPSSRSR
jgi:DNA-binding MarR family transcriptional regulator